jgi:hypothetical protein
VIFLAKQEFRYSLISISVQKSVPDEESGDTRDQLSIPTQRELAFAHRWVWTWIFADGRSEETGIAFVAPKRAHENRR